MAIISEISTITSNSTAREKPVVVRVKRKSWQSPLDAFWLEIDKRPWKRRLLDFEKLSIGDDDSGHGQVDGLKTKKVFVKHVETVDSSEDTFDVVQSFMSNSADAVEGKLETEERKRTLKEDNKKEQLLSKGRKIQEVSAQNACFQQIWRSRRETKEPFLDKLYEICHFYDVVRVNVEEGCNEMQEQESMQRNLSSHLPLPTDSISSAVAEIESDICAYLSEQGYEYMPRSVAEIESDLHASSSDQDDYVYDYYTMKNDMDIDDEGAISPFPLIRVEDDEEFYDGPDDELEYDTDDSNAEAHPDNDYPDEPDEAEDEMGSEVSTYESEDEESDGAGRSSEFEDMRDALSEDAVPLYEDVNYEYGDNIDCEDDYYLDYDYINEDGL